MFHIRPQPDCLMPPFALLDCLPKKAPTLSVLCTTFPFPPPTCIYLLLPSLRQGNFLRHSITSIFQGKMLSFAEHEQRLLHLQSLYDQGYAQNEFSECTKQCERSLLEHAGMAPFWRIKTCRLLLGSYQHDWHKAEVIIRRSSPSK